MVGAADKIEWPFVRVIVVGVALPLKVVRESDLLDGHALGFVVGRVWLVLGEHADVGGVCWEEAWEEPGHAAAEGRYTRAHDPHVELDVTPESRERTLVGHILGDGDWVDPDQTEDGDDACADTC
jgi:hypothetical protein